MMISYIKQKIEPMPKEQLNRIIDAFQKNGGIILMDNEAEAYLDFRNADGATLDSKTILLRKEASRSTVFEELIHTSQFKHGEIVDAVIDTIDCEIKAKEKLLKNHKAYKLTPVEVKETELQLEQYRIVRQRRNEYEQIQSNQ